MCVVHSLEWPSQRCVIDFGNRGRPSHVLLTVEDYQRITGGQKSIAELLAMPEAARIEFEPPRLKGQWHEPLDLS